MNALKKVKYFLLIIYFLVIVACGGRKSVAVRTDNFRINKLQLLKENVRRDAENPQVHYQLAKAYSEVDSMNLALASIKKSLTINPKYNPAKLLKGDLLLKKDQVKEAYSEYLEILNSDGGEEFVPEIRKHFGQPYPIYQLTSGEFNNAFPCFNPDDKQIVFQSDRDGNWEIYLMDVDGTQDVRLTNNAAQDEMPVFASKENIIAFTSTRDDTGKKSRVEKKRNIFLLDLETANVARQIDHPADDWYPALTNKGRQIVFTSERDDDRNVPFQERFSDIYLEDISKAKLFRLTQNEADDGSPSVSATGKLIIFTSNRKGSFQIFRMDNKGQYVEQVTDLPGNCGSPHFSHEGKKITFFADIYGNHDIFMMDFSGQNVERLTKHPAQDSYPSFSSDKRKILFHSNRSGKYQIYWIDLMNPLSYDELMDKLEEVVK